MNDLERAVKKGFSAGKYYILLWISSLVLIIGKTKEYIRYNELSELGVIKQSAFYFNFSNIISGVLLFHYFSRYFQHSRLLIYNANTTTSLGKISAVGQIGLGVFPNTKELHYIHLFFAILFFSTATFAMINYCKNYKSEKNRYLVTYGYLIGVYSIIYPLYLRGLSITKGIWQIIFSILLISWFIVETKVYKVLLTDNENTLDNSELGL